MTLGGSIAKWETPGYFGKIEIGTLHGPQSIRVVGGKGPLQTCQSDKQTDPI